jgi:DNA-binding NarL/FixJ family response regulator
MELIRTLLIEDDSTQCQLLREFLSISKDISGEVIDTGRLQAGLGILNAGERDTEKRVDVVVLDFGLPDGEGLNAITAIREISDRVAILVLSGDVSVAEGKQAIRMGADGVRLKPPESPDRFAWQVLEALETKRYKLAIKTKYEGMLVKEEEAAKPLLDKKSIIAIITAAAIAAITTFFAVFSDAVKAIFKWLFTRQG